MVQGVKLWLDVGEIVKAKAYRWCLRVRGNNKSLYDNFMFNY